MFGEVVVVTLAGMVLGYGCGLWMVDGSERLQWVDLLGIVVVVVIMLLLLVAAGGMKDKVNN